MANQSCRNSEQTICSDSKKVYFLVSILKFLWQLMASWHSTGNVFKQEPFCSTHRQPLSSSVGKTMSYIAECLRVFSVWSAVGRGQQTQKKCSSIILNLTVIRTWFRYRTYIQTYSTCTYMYVHAGALQICMLIQTLKLQYTGFSQRDCRTRQSSEMWRRVVRKKKLPTFRRNPEVLEFSNLKCFVVFIFVNFKF